MRPGLGWSCAAALVAACALPKVDIDPSLAPAAGAGRATVGGGGSGGTSGQTSGGTSGQAGGDDRELACDDYCTTYLMNCLTSPANTYDNRDDCLNTCFESDWPLGTDDSQPNSIQCRDLHAHLARDLPDPHCFHSAEVPSGAFCTVPAAN